MSEIWEDALEAIRVGLLLGRTLESVMTALFGSAAFLACSGCSLAARKSRCIGFPNDLHGYEMK